MLDFEFLQLSDFQYQLFLPVVPMAASVKTKLGKGGAGEEQVCEVLVPQRKEGAAHSPHNIRLLRKAAARRGLSGFPRVFRSVFRSPHSR